MTNEESGVIDLIQLLEDMLDMRECAMAIAIDQRDTELAEAVTNGIDAKVHRLLHPHVVRAHMDHEVAFAKATRMFGAGEGIFFAQIRNMSDFDEVMGVTTDAATAQMHAEAIKQVYDLAGAIVERAKGLHPMLFERTTPELIQLLKEREEYQREQEEREAAESVTASS